MAFARFTVLFGFLILASMLRGEAARAQAPDACAARLPTDRVTLNLREASVATTLRLLAQQYRVNMLVTEDIKGTVTLDFFRVPARDVFTAIIEASNLGCVVTGDVLRVSSLGRIKAEQEDQRKTQELARRLEADVRNKELDNQRKEQEFKEQLARGPIREETIRLQYADAEIVAITIQGILGLAPRGATPAPVPLPQLSQLYVPSPPLEIPSTAPEPLTAPTYTPSSDAIAKGLTVQAYKPTNSLFIRYYSRDLDRIKALIRESLDVPVPQIQIAAQMVITSLNALEQIGVQWGAGGAGTVNPAGTLVGQGFSSPNLGGSTISTAVPPATVGNLVNLPTALLPAGLGVFPAGGLLLGLIGSNFNINLAIQALELQGKARTLAEPKSVTVENSKATISRGFEVPYTSSPSQGVSQVQFKDALLKLEVTPRLITEAGERKIRMKVLFENNEPDFTRGNQLNGNPPIFKRRQDTEVVIRQGQRLVVGGVTNDTMTTTVREVPMFAKVPVLGWLFRSREISSTGEELIVIITPTVVSDGSPPPKR